MVVMTNALLPCLLKRCSCAFYSKGVLVSFTQTVQFRVNSNGLIPCLTQKVFFRVYKKGVLCLFKKSSSVFIQKVFFCVYSKGVLLGLFKRCRHRLGLSSHPLLVFQAILAEKEGMETLNFLRI